MRSRSPKELAEAKTQAILEKFEQWGRDHAGTRWHDALRRLAPLYGLATRSLEPIDPNAALILARARSAYERGERFAETHPPDPRSRNPRKALVETYRRKVAS